jgi:hypothetical protein
MLENEVPTKLSIESMDESVIQPLHMFSSNLHRVLMLLLDIFDQRVLVHVSKHLD